MAQKPFTGKGQLIFLHLMGDTPWPSLPSPSFCHNWDTSFNTKVIHSVSLCFHLVFVSEQPFVLFCPTLLPQIEVVNTFKSGTSFQGAGALRRQSSTTSQTQDVTNVSSPSHVSLSNALSSPTSTTAATAPSTTGRESDLCQSASLLSLLQGCHHVMNQKLLGLKQITFSILCGWHLWRVFFFSFVLSALSIPLSLFCLILLFIRDFRFILIFPPTLGCTVLSLVNVCVSSEC